MNIENIMPSERSQSEKNIFCMVQLCEFSSVDKYSNCKSRLVVPGPGWREKRGVIVNRQKFCFEGDG